jgi:hypothetical protein
MSTFISEIMSTLFRPAMVALVAAVGIAILAGDSDPNSVHVNQVNIADFSCNGLFKPVCRTFD